MKLTTYKIGLIIGEHYATLKINGITGVFFSYGRTVQEAIAGAFMNYYQWQLSRK